MLAAGAPFAMAALHAQGTLTEEFEVVGAPGFPDPAWCPTLQAGRAFVARHGGTLRRRHVGQWWDDHPTQGGR
jgi:hypothetical protein